LLLPSLIQKLRDRFPVEAPKQVDAINQDNHFMETHIAYAERLPHAVGLRDQVAIDQGDVQSIRVAEGNHGLMQIGQTARNCAASTSTSDNRDSDSPGQK
jgi:hypothetical protein